MRVYLLGEDIPPYAASTFLAQVLVQVLQGLQALQALQAPQAPQAVQVSVLVQVLQGLQVLQVLQAPQAVRVSVRSQSPKMSPETLKLQKTPLISSFTFTSFFLVRLNC
jgi:hypothetical protein